MKTHKYKPQKDTNFYQQLPQKNIEYPVARYY
jgi:hypothetical protein